MKNNSAVTSAQRQGPREYQEDRFVCEEFDGNGFRAWLIAVMDGHGGDAVAEYCRGRIGEYFAPAGSDDIENTLRKLVTRLALETGQFREGSTISVACVLENHQAVMVAVLGDSPVVVLDTTGKLHVSPEHNVRSNPAERKAAEARGGIYSRGYIWHPKTDAGLQLSRALGDARLGDVLSREPDVYTIQHPKWVLVASDGLFDPGHEETEKLLVEISGLAKSGADASKLMEHAEHRGLHDNATAVVWQKS